VKETKQKTQEGMQTEGVEQNKRKEKPKRKMKGREALSDLDSEKIPAAGYNVYSRA